MALDGLQHNSYAYNVGDNPSDDEKELIANQKDSHPGQAYERQDIAQVMGTACRH